MTAMNIYQALLSAQAAFGPVLKTSTNPAFKTKYADLSSVIDAITPALHANGLVVVQRFVMDAGGPILATELIHAASGERITSTIAIVSKDPLNPQSVGGAITYYRRYSLVTLLGLAPEDDDGNLASKPAARSDAPVARSAPTQRAEPTRVVAQLIAAEQDTQDAERVGRPLDWTDVWTEARKRDIRDRPALAAALGANPGTLAPADIVALLLEMPVPAGIAG